MSIRSTRGLVMTGRVTSDEMMTQLSSVSRNFVARFLGVPIGTVTSWVNYGAEWFDHTSMKCNLPEAVRWYIGTMKGDEVTLKQQKLEQEVEYKKAQVQKLRGAVIDRMEHEQILASRAASLRHFLENASGMNAAKFTDLTIEQARVRLLDFVKEALEECSAGVTVG
jgi:hypothetical protein